MRSCVHARRALRTTALGEPRNYPEAATRPNTPSWQMAINEELQAHDEDSTWVVVERPKGGTRLTCRWVFAIKRDSEGRVEGFKARLVARDFQQRHGADYFESFAPIARIETIRTMLSIAAINRLEILQSAEAKKVVLEVRK